MHGTEFTIKAKVWLYPGKAAWHFISVPKRTASQIKGLYAGLERGWGSFPVTVTLGATVWKTSIFPDSKTGTFLLPLKADVRKKEKVSVGQTIVLQLQVRL